MAMTIRKRDSAACARIDRVADELINAFEWSETPQGFEYWSKVHATLDALIAEEQTITTEEFNQLLTEHLDDQLGGTGMRAALTYLLDNVPGVHEAVSKHFHDDVLALWRVE